MKTNLFSLLALLFCTQSVFAQNFDTAKLNNYFKALADNNKFMGSVAVSKNGKIIYTRSIGFADIKNNIKLNDSTKYRIGSITKTFTASLILKAVEENKLSLSQTLEKYLPSVKNAEKITISELLYHRSGIHNFTDNADYLTWNMQPKTEQQMVEIIAKGGSDFEPGSKFQYSNSNYVLLTYILEKVYNKSYTELLNEEIIAPLHLANTYYGGEINIQHNECYSYTFSNKGLKKEDETDMSVPAGAGAIVSNPVDLTKFANALFAYKIVNKKSLEQMQTLKDNFGMGLIAIPFYDKKGLGHTGGIDGFSSVFIYFPADTLAYALCSNATNMNNNDISIAVLSAVYDKPYNIPTFTTIQLTSTDLDKYPGVYTSKEIPLKITITKSGNTLVAQATGQPSFELDATAKDTFKFEKAGIVLVFDRDKKEMILKQRGATFKFTKE